jgi:transposase
VAAFVRIGWLPSIGIGGRFPSESVAALPRIPQTRSRSKEISYDKHIYKELNLVERFFSKIKHFRRIATRYEKTALSFAAMSFLVGAIIWLR